MFLELVISSTGASISSSLNLYYLLTNTSVAIESGSKIELQNFYDIISNLGSLQSKIKEVTDHVEGFAVGIKILHALRTSEMYIRLLKEKHDVVVDGSVFRQFVFKPDLTVEKKRKSSCIDYMMIGFGIDSKNKTKRKTWIKLNLSLGTSYLLLSNALGFVELIFCNQWSKVRFDKKLLLELQKKVRADIGCNGIMEIE